MLRWSHDYFRALWTIMTIVYRFHTCHLRLNMSSVVNCSIMLVFWNQSPLTRNIFSQASEKRLHSWLCFIRAHLILLFACPQQVRFIPNASPKILPASWLSISNSINSWLWWALAKDRMRSRWFWKNVYKSESFFPTPFGRPVMLHWIRSDYVRLR